MDVVEQFTNKVQEAANEILRTKKKNQQLLAEIELLRRELGKHNRIIRENDHFRKERDRLRTRLERLNKKIDKLLGVKPPAKPVLASQGPELNEQLN